MSNQHVPFCVCQHCPTSTLEKGLCEDRMQHGADPYQDYFECSKPEGHEGDHGFADVDMDSRPFVTTWTRSA